MSKPIESIIEYLKNLFGDQAVAISWKDSDLLPSYLRNSYDFFWTSMLNREFLLAICKYDKTYKLSDIKKHIQQLRKSLPLDSQIVFALKSASNYQRSQLIKEKVSFIVPDKHLYIPFLGAAFTEWYSKKAPGFFHLSLSGQALFFELITSGLNSKSQEEMGRRLGLGKMAVSRAFHELESVGVVQKNKVGRVNKWSVVKHNRDLWDTVELYLFNPIVSRVYVSKTSPSVRFKLIQAGETALAENTMLGFPKLDTYAISKSDWHKIKEDFITVSHEDINAYCIELWKHQIPLYKGKIHPLALYTTLRENRDERVQKSLEELKSRYLLGGEQLNG